MKKGKRKPSAKKIRPEKHSSLPLLRPLSSASTSCKLFRDCRIELDRFLEVLIDKDYRRLIIEGDAPESVLKEAWATIYLQYCELQQDGTYNELFDKTKKIQEINGRITLLDGIVQHLQLCYDALLVKMVNEMGIGLELESSEDPMKKLKMVQGRIKRMILDMQNMEQEIEGMQHEKRETNGIEYYEDWLSAMSRAYGYAVRAKDISVMQFVRNQKKLNEQSLKQQKDAIQK